MSSHNSEAVVDHHERLSPLEKVIASENLSYLPNLYFRKYKLLEGLNHERFNFPEQKILVPRPKTSWDSLICQVKQKAELRVEMKKFKQACNYQLSKNCKEESIKRELKKQEQYLFHRIVANQLSESVLEAFQEFRPSQSVSGQQQNADPSSSVENQQKTEDFSIQNKKQNDDIFIDKGDNDNFDAGVHDEGIDLFNDILNDHKEEMKEEAPAHQIPGEEVNQIRKVGSYVKDFIEMEFKQREEEKLQKSEGDMQDESEIVENQRSTISRKSCFKKINENLRRRLKSKGVEEENRSLTSATVSISNLINNFPECKNAAKTFVDLPSTTEWIFDQNMKVKRRKDEDFELKWSKQQIEEFKTANPNFQISHISEVESIRQLSIDREEYGRAFQRNILGDYDFPNNLRSVQEFSKRFDKKHFYYNHFHDQEYERFIMKNNKRKLLKNFEKNSAYMFPENQIVQEINQNQPISTGALFLHPLGKISDRIIYKVAPGSTKITAVSKAYNKKALSLSREKMILIAYLVNQFLGQFGNNWKAITEFVQIFPCFSGYLISVEAIQEIYQIVNKHELKIPHFNGMEVWDKRLLPSSQLFNQSYQTLSLDNSKNIKNGILKDEKIPISNAIEEQETAEENYDSVIDDYQALLNEPLEKTQKIEQIQNQSMGNRKNAENLSSLKKLSQNFKTYSKSLSSYTTEEVYNRFEGKVSKGSKVINDFNNTFAGVKTQAPSKNDTSLEGMKYVHEHMTKGDIKGGLPYRKKKSKIIFDVSNIIGINEKNNELVKILQALRSKSTGSSQPMNQHKMAPQQHKQSAHLSNTPKVTPPGGSMTNLPANTAKQGATETPGDKDALKKTKTPDKKVGGAVKKKKKDADEDKK